jgi:hypothetical protein
MRAKVKYAFVLILLAFSCLNQGQAMADASVEVDSVLASLRADLAAGRVKRADVYFMSYDRLTRTRVTPAMLEAQADKKFSLETVPQSFVRAIENITLHKVRDSPDLRWGLVFWNRSGNRVHSIYLDGRYILGTGRKGYIDGVTVGFNASLVDWLESNYVK